MVLVTIGFVAVGPSTLLFYFSSKYSHSYRTKVTARVIPLSSLRVAVVALEFVIPIARSRFLCCVVLRLLLPRPSSLLRVASFRSRILVASGFSVFVCVVLCARSAPVEPAPGCLFCCLRIFCTCHLYAGFWVHFEVFPSSAPVELAPGNFFCACAFVMPAVYTLVSPSLSLTRPLHCVRFT